MDVVILDVQIYNFASQFTTEYIYAAVNLSADSVFQDPKSIFRDPNDMVLDAITHVITFEICSRVAPFLILWG